MSHRKLLKDSPALLERVKPKALLAILILAFILPPLCRSGVFSSSHPFQEELHSQSPTKRVNTDTLFQQARQKAFSGDREGARKICLDILETKPEYHDARVFLGRLYGWEKNYDLARAELKIVLEAKPLYNDARNALIDIEYWSDNLKHALALCEEGLENNPQYEDFLFKKARVLLKLNRDEEASDTLDVLLKINPSHQEGLALSTRLKKEDPIAFGGEVASPKHIYKTKVMYRYDAFGRGEKAYGPWHLGAFEVSGKYGFGSIIGRINYANRTFGSTAKSGLQYEVDLYPKLAKGLYAYLNSGYSASSLFPKYRAGGEIFTSLPASFEMSAGFRYLSFSSRDVWIYTGSLGKYHKNLWFSLRPFITPKTAGTSVSLILFIRNYLKDGDNYYGISIGYGSSPAEVVFLEDLERYNTFKVSAVLQRTLTRTLLIKLSFRFEREEFQLNVFGNRFTLEVNFQNYFNRRN